MTDLIERLRNLNQHGFIKYDDLFIGIEAADEIERLETGWKVAHEQLLAATAELAAAWDKCEERRIENERLREELAMQEKLYADLEHVYGLEVNENNKLREELAETKQTLVNHAQIQNELSEELAKAQKDAERYRWLADDMDGNEQDDFIRTLIGYVLNRKEFDAAIDKAMEESK